MIETDLENIKEKLKNDNININDLEKKLLKIEKKILSLENKYNNIQNNIDNDIINDNDNDDINIDDILADISKLEYDITNINSSISLENLIDNYIDYIKKINSIKIQNEEFRLSIEYL